jgi:formate C-acetyltransferase
VLDLAMNASLVRDAKGFEAFTSLIESFLIRPSTAALQVNMVDRETLLKAREDPESPLYRTLIVRVWGFSALFVELSPELQDHVLARTEHRLGV